jgi:hypothetical protein
VNYSEARAVLHHAALLVSALGKGILPPRPDASHKCVIYDPGQRAFTSPKDEGLPFRAALRLPEMSLLLLDAGGNEQGRFVLAGRTLDRAEAWLNDRLRECWPDAPRSRIARARYTDLAAHAVEAGGVVPVIEEEFLDAMEQHYALSRIELEEVRAGNREGRAGPVRIWPHHFDQAVSIPLDEGGGEEARSIGVGFSPGDSDHRGPYWYVTAWPPPARDRLPTKSGVGAWHAAPFYGATLQASPEGGPDARTAARVRAFYAAATETAEKLLTSP